VLVRGDYRDRDHIGKHKKPISYEKAFNRTNNQQIADISHYRTAKSGLQVWFSLSEMPARKRKKEGNRRE
jgi:hypothetical protein